MLSLFGNHGGRSRLTTMLSCFEIMVGGLASPRCEVCLEIMVGGLASPRCEILLPSKRPFRSWLLSSIEHNHMHDGDIINMHLLYFYSFSIFFPPPTSSAAHVLLCYSTCIFFFSPSLFFSFLFYCFLDLLLEKEK
jgi:hypothetical protein